MEVRDPVCGMLLDDKTAPETAIYEGTTYYLCSTSCKKIFDEHPELYAAEIPLSTR